MIIISSSNFCFKGTNCVTREKAFGCLCKHDGLTDQMRADFPSDVGVGGKQMLSLSSTS